MNEAPKLSAAKQGMAVRQGPLRLLPAFLFDTRQGKAAYVFKAWLLTLLPSVLLAGIVGALVPDAQPPEFGEPGPLLIFLIVIFAPVVETLIMVPPLLLLNRLLGPVPAVILSAAGWGIAHSLQAATWGLVIWWPFLVFSTILLVWRERSLNAAMLIVMSVHALQNALPALSLLAAGALGGA